MKTHALRPMLFPLAVATWFTLAGAPLLAAAPRFKSAQPVWPEGRATEKNVTVGFRAAFAVPPGQPVMLRVTGSTLYRLWLNGQFLAHGPARGPHGFYRVDELDLTARLAAGTNLVAIEVAGYNANSYYLLDQPSFLQAEVVTDGQVLAATAGDGAPFEAVVLRERVQQVQRYSFQRPFTEVYRLTPGFDAWRRQPDAPLDRVRCAVVDAKALLPRRVSHSAFAKRGAATLVASGELVTGRPPEPLWKDRSLTQVGPALGGYLEPDLATIPSLELQTIANASNRPVHRPLHATDMLALAPRAFHLVDFGVNLTGFVGAKVVCHRPARLFLTFDEILRDGDVDFKRLGCVNALVYELEPGTYEIESFEPYTLRYLKLFTLAGDCDVSGLYLREYVCPDTAQAHFAASDERLNRLFAAGRETFQQNAVDLFMDCPSRERAGWLCDSFFTARVAQDLCGHTRIERNFLENYALPPRFAHLPDGMLPMCYPADHNDGVYIPNWALWFVLELEEYLERSGDRELVEALRPRVLALVEYFQPYRNGDGLLERLPSWVFVEWSKANEFVQDVNYPSNMLYARMLEATARLYDLPDLAHDAEQMRAVIRRQSFDGDFFVDNALRQDGRLQVTRNRSEVCQYFAFYFGVATPASHPQLWETLVRDFGPQRRQTQAFPEIHSANQFVGNVLRLELLSRIGRCQQVADEAFGYWLFMADKTGTLWENDGDYASCNHGFASHAVRVLNRDVLGLARLDTVRREIHLRFTEVHLDWCEGSLPTPDGSVALRWRRDGERLRYKLSAPAGYAVTVENLSRFALVRE
jgi:alpha-L-rhamnosidase